MIKGVAVNALGVIPKLLRPLYLILFSRALGIEKYGLYILVTVFVEVFAKFTIMGTNGGILHLMSFLKDRKQEKFIPTVIHLSAIGVFIFGLLIASLLYFFAPWVAHSVFDKPEITDELRYFVWILPVISTAYVYAGALRDTMNMKYEVLNQSFLEPLIILIFGLIFIHFFGVMGLAFAYILAHTTTTTIMCAVTKKIYGPFVWAKEVIFFPWKKFLRDSFYYFGMRGLNLLKHQMDVFIVGRFFTLKDVAIYSAALEISAAIKRLRFVLEPILMPVVQSIEKAGISSQETKRYLSSILRYLSYPCLLVIGFLMIKSKFVLSFFGPNFTQGVDLVVILVLAQYFFSVFGILEAVLYMYGKTHVAFLHNIYLLVLNVCLLIVLIPQYGLMGAALSTLIAVFVVGWLNVYKHYTIKGYIPFVSFFARHVTIFSVLMAILFVFRKTFLQNEISSWITAGFFVATFGGYILHELKHSLSFSDVRKVAS